MSDEAIIGIYYFKNGSELREEIKYIIDNDIKGNCEYQLTDVLENLKQKGRKFGSVSVNEWMDCGNKNAVLDTNQRVLQFEMEAHKRNISKSMHLTNGVIIPPVFIGENVRISGSVVGPNVSIGNNTSIENSVITNTLVQENSQLRNLVLDNAMIGNHAALDGKAMELDLGDYSRL